MKPWGLYDEGGHNWTALYRHNTLLSNVWE